MVYIVALTALFSIGSIIYMLNKNANEALKD